MNEHIMVKYMYLSLSLMLKAPIYTIQQRTNRTLLVYFVTASLRQDPPP